MRTDTNVATKFSHDPLRWLDEVATSTGGVRWISETNVCVYDADTARDLLRNKDGRLREHSDFFGDGPPSLSPRSAQIALGRACLARVQAHLRGADIDARLAELGERSEWPRAGNALLFAIMRPILAAPTRPPAFQRALERMVETRILRRHDPPPSWLARVADRFRFFRAFASERATTGRIPHDDILALVLEAGESMDDEALAQLYAGFVFALVGSIGFALGWSVLLALRHDATHHRPAHLVQEALRLFPIAWLLDHRVARPDVILGERVTPAHTLSISPYAIHRNPAYWDEPADFLPERWLGRTERNAWLPFGAGGHSCIAVSLSLELLAQLLTGMFARPLTLEETGGAPSIGAALAPPRFAVLRSA